MRWLATLALATVAATAAADAPRPLALVGGTIVDGYGNAPLRNGVILVEGERIAAVGTVGQLAVPPGAEIISTEGMTVLPGLRDLQAHLARLGQADERRWSEHYLPIAERVVMPLAAAQLLAAGVTSARDAGAPPGAALRVRERLRERRLPGPTLFVPGPLLVKTDRPGGESWRWAVNGADDVRRRVQRLAQLGPD